MVSESFSQHWLAPVKAKIAGASRPDVEQAALRLMLSAMVLVYLAWYVARDGMIVESERQALAVVFTFFVFASALAAVNLYAPEIIRTTRIVGIVVDNAIVTYALIAMGESGAVLLWVYLFAIIGNGFRYGRFYLHLSQLFAMTGFWLVILAVPFWGQHLAVSSGFMIALIVLPFYVAALAQRIARARRQAEDRLHTEIKLD
jgi:two-component system, sensor histidine kinase RpfC